MLMLFNPRLFEYVHLLHSSCPRTSTAEQQNIEVLRRVEEVRGSGCVQTVLLRDHYPHLKQFTVILVVTRRFDQAVKNSDASECFWLKGSYIEP